ncbi:hypothetical protein [Humibacter soli]
MSLRRRMTAAALALLTAAALAGCATPEPSPTPTTRATSAPLFASDAEALAAATKAYAAYLKVSDEISHDGGRNPERIKPYVTKAEYANESASFTSLAEKTWHAAGTTSFDKLTLAKVGPRSIDAYVCVDVSKVRLLDPSNADVTPQSTSERQPIDLGFDSVDGVLRVSRSRVWESTGYC